MINMIVYVQDVFLFLKGRNMGVLKISLDRHVIN